MLADAEVNLKRMSQVEIMGVKTFRGGLLPASELLDTGGQ